jgi:hypothetical protein
MSFVCACQKIRRGHIYSPSFKNMPNKICSTGGSLAPQLEEDCPSWLTFFLHEVLLYVRPEA